MVAIRLTIVLILFALTSVANEKKYTEEEFKTALEKAVQEKVVERLEKVQVSNLSKYSQDLLNKELELMKKEKKVDELEKQLSRSQKEFSKRVGEFEKQQQKFIGCIDENQKKKNERITKVVQMISGMKPLKAAEVLSVQDTNLSVEIIGSLKPEKASKILNLMDKEISARLQKQYLNMQQ